MKKCYPGKRKSTILKYLINSLFSSSHEGARESFCKVFIKPIDDLRII